MRKAAWPWRRASACRLPLRFGMERLAIATDKSGLRSGRILCWNHEAAGQRLTTVDHERSIMTLSRRRFLQAAAAATGSAWLAAGAQSWALAPLSIANPLGAYPNRDWERVYLDQYCYDDTFTWVCAPNDTHMCRLRAFVRNGVMLRSEQNYDHDRCSDLYGNKATKAWNPRGCPKGYTMQRRVYGPYRAKGPVLRKGWKEWADAG